MKEKKKELKMAIKDKMTVSEVTDMFGVSVTTVRNWEKETRGIAPKWLEAWRKVL